MVMAYDTGRSLATKHGLKTMRSHSVRPSRRFRYCDLIPPVKEVLHQFACPDPPDEEDELVTKVLERKPDDISIWNWELQKQKYGNPPSKSEFRTAKYRWEEKKLEEAATPAECNGVDTCPPEPPKKKFINPFSSYKKKNCRRKISGGEKRKIIERWGKLWDSALSDIKFDRTVFENNPGGEQTYKNDEERINDGCQKLCEITKMNQNVITLMMKKFVSGPPNKLYSLNRIEAAQCWSRIINGNGVVNDKCCVATPSHKAVTKYNIPSLKPPPALRNDPELFNKMSVFRLPSPKRGQQVGENLKVAGKKQQEQRRSPSTAVEGSSFKKNPKYWLDPKLVPPVPPGFKEEEFEIEPKNDPTGEIRRDLMKAKKIARRYTRFAHIIEKAIHVVPNLDKVNQTMDEHFVSKDPDVRRQTLLHNFFSSPKMDTSPEFKNDAMYATILSRNDNAKENIVKKPYPYSLAEMSKSKSKAKLRTMT